MKKFLIVLIAIFATHSLSCKTTNALANINDAIGKEWKLIEVRLNNKNTDFDRGALAREGFNGAFTIKIDSELISGVGAPNRYSAPYTISIDDPTAVKIEVVRSTLMATLNNPEKLKEHDFFVYIQNTYKWGLLDGNLELHSKTDSGIPVVMKFSL